MVDGGLSMADGRWWIVNGRWSMVDGGLSMVNGRLSMADGPNLPQLHDSSELVVSHNLFQADLQVCFHPSPPSQNLYILTSNYNKTQYHTESYSS